MNGETNGATLVGDGAQDGLLDPPRGIRGKLEALFRIKFLDGADESQRPFLDQILEGEPAVLVALGDVNNEAKVRRNHCLLRVVAARHFSLQLGSAQPNRSRPLVG